MAYRYGERTQLTLLPNCIDQYVREDDPVRVYDAFVEAIDPKSIGLELNENAVGNSSYDPITMMKLLVYGYSYGLRSSRKIERALHHNLSFIWLVGGLKPDHKTISEFRRTNKSSIKKVLKQCAQICLKLGLIEGNTLFFDGTKFRGNAGKAQTKKVKSWESYKEHVEKKIEELLEESQRADETEQESLVQINKELKSQERLKEKIGSLLETIDQDSISKKENRSINGTDPDCQIMKSRQGSHTSYNTQMGTDEANGLIVSIEATGAQNDLNQLSRQVKNAEENLGKKCEEVCADAGYSSSKDLATLVEEEKRVVVPTNKQVQKNKTDNPFDKNKFTYNSQTNTYTCPQGKEMIAYKYDQIRNRTEYHFKSSSTCKNCIHYGVCTKSKTGRRLYRLVEEEVKEKLEKYYESEEGQKIYAKRKMRVEHPFGHMKYNLGVGSFLLRGFEGVNAELSLLATCFNITRMITIVGGANNVIEKLKTIPV